MWLFFLSLSGLQMDQDKKWNSQLWLLSCWLTSLWFLPGWVYFLLQSDMLYYILYFKSASVSGDYKNVWSLFYQWILVCFAFVSPYGHWLRSGFKFYYKLLLLTRIWLHPGVNACSRQQCVLCCTACKFLLHYCLYTAENEFIYSAALTSWRHRANLMS